MHSSHHAALETRHAGLDRRIAEENLRPVPDAFALSELKRQKLRLKDEMLR